MDDTTQTRRTVRLVKEIGQAAGVLVALVGALVALLTKTDTRKSKAAYDELKEMVQTDHDAVVRLGTIVEIATSEPAEPAALQMGALVVTPVPSASVALPARLTPVARDAGAPPRRAPPGGGALMADRKEAPRAAPPGLRALKSFDDL